MRYMMMIKATPDSEAGAAPKAAVMAGMAQRAVEVHAKAGVDVELEVRPLFEPPDFGSQP